MKEKIKRISSKLKNSLDKIAVNITPVLLGIIAFSFFGFLLILAGAKGPQWHGDYIRNKVGTVTVKIVKDNTERSGGTGFVIKTEKGNSYVMTNAHVCELSEDGNALIVTPDGSRRMPRRILEISKEHDLCLVESIPGLEGVSIADNDASIGEVIAVVGHPALYPLTLTRGEFRGFTSINLIKAVNVPEKDCKGPNLTFIPIPEDSLEAAFGLTSVCIQAFSTGGTSAQIFPGSSGSPVVNFWGSVIGVIFAGDRRGASSFFVPLSEVKKFTQHY